MNSTDISRSHDLESEHNELMSPLGYIGAAITLFCIGFFGFFLNLFVIILMCREKKLWTPLNVILFNLVCSDFFVSILGNPLTLASSIAHKWIFGHAACVLYGYFMALLGITSITTLTVLAFERYLIVSKPFSSHNLTKRSAKLMIVAIWMYSAALTTPPLFGWGDYINEAANISCSVNWQEQTFNTTTYIMFLFFFGLIVPVCVIVYSYVNIIRTMKQNTMRMSRVNKQEGKVTYMVAAMIIAFLVAWTPYAILALLTQFGDPNLVSPAVAVVPALFAKSSICYNPLIYVGLNAQFRPSWKQLFGIANIETSIGENDMTVMATRVLSQMTQESLDGMKTMNTLHLTDNTVILKNSENNKNVNCTNSITLINNAGDIQTTLLND